MGFCARDAQLNFCAILCDRGSRCSCWAFSRAPFRDSATPRHASSSCEALGPGTAIPRRRVSQQVPRSIAQKSGGRNHLRRMRVRRFSSNLSAMRCAFFNVASGTSGSGPPMELLNIKRTRWHFRSSYSVGRCAAVAARACTNAK